MPIAAHGAQALRLRHLPTICYDAPGNFMSEVPFGETPSEVDWGNEIDRLIQEHLVIYIYIVCLDVMGIFLAQRPFLGGASGPCNSVDQHAAVEDTGYPTHTQVSPSPARFYKEHIRAFSHQQKLVLLQSK